MYCLGICLTSSAGSQCLVYLERGSNLLDPGIHFRYSSKGPMGQHTGTSFLEGKHQLWDGHYTLGVSHSGLPLRIRATQPLILG